MIVKKHWSLLTVTQKRHRLFHVTQNKLIFFWGVCGKDRQNYYNHLEITEENADLVRDQMYDEYMSMVEKSFFFDKDLKIEQISILLGKGKYEEVLHDLAIKHK